MNRRVAILTALICLGIVIACVMAGSTYYARVTVPMGMTQEISQTLSAATISALNASGTESAIQTLSAIPTSTPLPSPTLTPTLIPQATTCDAEVVGTSRALYPVPGQGHALFNKIIEAGTIVKVVGRLSDAGWYKTEANNESGWMKSNSLKLLNSCRPTVFDLHYLANWLSPDEMLIIDDTFSSNTNVWIDAASQKNILVNTTPQGEAILLIQSDNERNLPPVESLFWGCNNNIVYTCIYIVCDNIDFPASVSSAWILKANRNGVKPIDLYFQFVVGR